MAEKVSEFEGRFSGFEGGTGWLDVLVAADLVRNEGLIDVMYNFPFLRKPGEVRLDEYRGKRVKVTVEVIEEEEKWV